jgi:hypothetical protein
VQIRSYVRGVPADQHVKGIFIWEVDRSIHICLCVKAVEPYAK